MTDPRSPAHLDDEALSALLDGEGGGGAPGHVDGCASCSARLAALTTARDAVRAATVPPLAASILDDLVAGALAAPAADAVVVPLDPSRHGRRLRTPPPAWIVSAVAAIAAVVGVAGLLRTGGAGDRVMSESAESGAALDAAADSQAESTSGATAAAGAAGARDPELVAADLGELADAPGLSAALAATPGFAARSAATTGGAAPAGGGTAADTGVAADEGSRAPTPEAVASAPPAAADAPATTAFGAAGPPDRARCRAEAERLGAGRLGTLLTTATLRWAGQPAEVLVFALTEPAGGLTRQALVLARPGCALLADPRL